MQRRLVNMQRSVSVFLFNVFLIVLLSDQSRTIAAVLPQAFPSPAGSQIMPEKSPGLATTSASNTLLYLAPKPDTAMPDEGQKQKLERRHYAPVNKSRNPRGKSQEQPQLLDMLDSQPRTPQQPQNSQTPRDHQGPQDHQELILPINTTPEEQQLPTDPFERPPPPLGIPVNDVQPGGGLVRREVEDRTNALVRRSSENTEIGSDGHHDRDVKFEEGEEEEKRGKTGNPNKLIPGSGSTGSSSTSTNTNERKHATDPVNRKDNLISFFDSASKRHNDGHHQIPREIRQDSDNHPVSFSPARTSAALRSFDFHNLNTNTERELYAIVKGLLVPRPQYLDRLESEGPREEEEGEPMEEARENVIEGERSSQRRIGVQSSWSMWLMCMQIKVCL